MNCTKCNKTLDISNFSYKNKEQKIYYLHCDNCRQKIISNKNKSINEKNQYENVKKSNYIECECGKKFVVFRDFHLARHYNSKKHQQFILSQ